MRVPAWGPVSASSGPNPNQHQHERLLWRFVWRKGTRGPCCVVAGSTRSSHRQQRVSKAQCDVHSPTTSAWCGSRSVASGNAGFRLSFVVIDALQVGRGAVGHPCNLAAATARRKRKRPGPSRFPTSLAPSSSSTVLSPSTIKRTLLSGTRQSSEPPSRGIQRTTWPWNNALFGARLLRIVTLIFGSCQFVDVAAQAERSHHRHRVHVYTHELHLQLANIVKGMDHYLLGQAQNFPTRLARNDPHPRQ